MINMREEINIQVTGNIDTLHIDYCNKLSISGDVNSVKTSSGDVEISGSNSGSVKTSSGEVEIGGNVGGDVETSSGNVRCGNIQGRVSTNSGNIKHN